MMLVGLDLGQARDWTAVAVAERSGPVGQATYAIRHLERWLGVPYPEQVARVRTLLLSPELRGAPLVLDQTGIGRPVFDMFCAAGLRPIGIQIHGGDVVTGQGMEWRVPKRDLVAVVAVLLQAHRLQIAAGLAEAATLVHELQQFRMTINLQTSHDSYAAWREADHDDAVLATALAVWYGERFAYVATPLVGGTRPLLAAADQMKRMALGQPARGLDLSGEQAQLAEVQEWMRRNPR